MVGGSYFYQQNKIIDRIDKINMEDARRIEEGNLFEIYIFSQDNDHLTEDTSDKVFNINNYLG